MDLKQIEQVAVRAAKKAGRVILEKRPGSITEKSRHDFVTETDFLCQELILNTIKENFPNHSFIAEEDEYQENISDPAWIIDPLDGTANYIHDLKHSAVSIAFAYQNELLVGVVYDPFKSELFTARKGQGAFLNGVQIHVSNVNSLNKSLIATGFPFKYPDKIDDYLKAFKEVMIHVSGIRRIGTAALDLAYVAAGRFDAFYEGWLMPWDLAAGTVIIREAGGLVSDFNGESDFLFDGCIIAGNKKIYSDFKNLFVNLSNKFKRN